MVKTNNTGFFRNREPAVSIVKVSHDLWMSLDNKMRLWIIISCNKPPLGSFLLQTDTEVHNLFALIFKGKKKKHDSCSAYTGSTLKTSSEDLLVIATMPLISMNVKSKNPILHHVQSKWLKIKSSIHLLYCLQTSVESELEYFQLQSEQTLFKEHIKSSSSSCLLQFYLVEKTAYWHVLSDTWWELSIV